MPLFLPNPRHALLPFRKREKESTLFYPLATESVRRNFSPSSFFLPSFPSFPNRWGRWTVGEREMISYYITRFPLPSREKKFCLIKLGRYTIGYNECNFPLYRRATKNREFCDCLVWDRVGKLIPAFIAALGKGMSSQRSIVFGN